LLFKITDIILSFLHTVVNW